MLDINKNYEEYQEIKKKQLDVSRLILLEWEKKDDKI